LKPLFAYFTDVHGNKDALQAVLEDAASNGADHFICGGDMIGIGPYVNEVLDVLFNLPSIQMVTGNHDEAVLALKFGERHPLSHIHAKKHHEWIADRLENHFARKLKCLRRELIFTNKHFRFLITHYPYKQDKKESPISEDPFMSIISEPDLSSMHELFGINPPYDFIGFGHHHILHDFKDKNTHFVNPGALGCHPVAKARYALVYEVDLKLHVEFKSVPYDRSQMLQAYKDYDVPEAAFLIKTFHHL
jgi:predicted phosphodiesterase